MGINGVQIEGALNLRASNGGLVWEAKLKVNAVTNMCFYAGLTDQASALEMPYQHITTTYTSTASDAVGFLFDSASSTQTWKLVGVKADADASNQDSGTGWSAATYIDLRIELDTSGNATFYIDGAQAGTVLANAVTAGTALAPVVACFTRGAVQRTIDGDYVLLGMDT
jgi:hypothetical protein